MASQVVFGYGQRLHLFTQVHKIYSRIDFFLQHRNMELFKKAEIVKDIFRPLGYFLLFKTEENKGREWQWCLNETLLQDGETQKEIEKELK